ncbi:hypothetical protein [Nocardia sp. NPDC004860]|uniref:hypothetical protein n=1 Tax=Nocardia sp. NPDC004860 TaxID=3154557 RepID=UPI0033A711EF
MNSDGWLPAEGDVHVRIWLGGVVFDYTAAASAVHHLVQDWSRKHWCTIELMLNAIDDRRLLSRLPCEQLFLGP